MFLKAVSPFLFTAAILIGIGQICNTSASISRDDVIRRAKFWSDNNVAYSQSKYHADPDGKLYRTDCSGYVSMAWKLSTSLNTRSLTSVSISIRKNDLKSGDIMLRPGIHALIFDKWTSNANTSYWAYEETPPKAIYRQVRYPYFSDRGYSPYRYKNIA